MPARRKIATGTFAAYAAMIANMPAELAETCRPRGAVAMMIVAGTADTIMPYGGGVIRGGLNGVVLGAEATAVYWAQHIGCGGIGQPQAFPDVDKDDKSVIELMDRVAAAYKSDAKSHSDPRSGRPDAELMQLALEVARSSVGVRGLLADLFGWNDRVRGSLRDISRIQKERAETLGTLTEAKVMDLVLDITTAFKRILLDVIGDAERVEMFEERVKREIHPKLRTGKFKVEA